MHAFLQRHASRVMGVLHGFDRMRFRGTLRQLAHGGGMREFLFRANVLFKDFKDYVISITDQVREAAQQTADQAGRPLKYLASSATNKEAIARQIAASDGVKEGLVCVLSCVELCRSYQVTRNPQAKRLELHSGLRKCLHYYYYFQHPRLGWMHARLQTWFPFTMHMNLNGREWLCQELDRAGIDYLRRENCLTHVADECRAQQLLDRQLRINWPRLLNSIAKDVHPRLRQIVAPWQNIGYYWSLDESEWATDVMFRSPSALADLYPRLVRHAMSTFGSREVLRFLGRKTPRHGGPCSGNFQGEVTTDLRQRPEGMRIKHRLNHNSLKMYDKQGSVLRVETTINDPHDIKVFRAKEGDEGGAKDWRILRKGVADLHRRAQVSQAANERYLAGLAAANETTALAKLSEPLCRPTQYRGKRVRALNPLSGDDAALLESVSRAEFLVHGFRNHDLQPLLYGAPPRTKEEQRRRSAAVTRKLRLLRAHGLIRKVPKSHRYLLSDQGQRVITAVLAARQADTAKLTAAA